jgi:predicted NAD/FAD-binding protein
MDRAAVIGTGVAGLTAAYILSKRDAVTLFEADERPGGHARTRLVGVAATPVDTGFMVFNAGRYCQRPLGNGSGSIVVTGSVGEQDALAE